MTLEEEKINELIFSDERDESFPLISFIHGRGWFGAYVTKMFFGWEFFAWKNLFSQAFRVLTFLYPDNTDESTPSSMIGNKDASTLFDGKVVEEKKVF